MKVSDFLLPTSNHGPLRIFSFGLSPHEYSIKIALMPLPSKVDYLEKISSSNFKKIISLCSADRNIIKAHFEKHADFKIIPLYIKDFTAPNADQFFLAFEEVKKSILLKEDVLIHCFAGYGRSGSILAGITMQAIYHYYKKLPHLVLNELIDTIRSLDHEKNQSIETIEQLNALEWLEQKLKASF